MPTSMLSIPPRIPAARKRWTVGEFHLLCGLPEFESSKMILVDGEILDMPKPNPPHDIGAGQTEEALRDSFGAGFWVRVQMALVFGLATDPMPDLAVVPGPRRKYTTHPASASLVAEVSESSLAYDLGDKSNLYAAGGIPEYWVVDLNNRCLHVFREPAPDAAEPFGFRYQTQTTLARTDTVTPLHAPQAAIAVADLLP
jgi:Uma2 family endonuclease